MKKKIFIALVAAICLMGCTSGKTEEESPVHIDSETLSASSEETQEDAKPSEEGTAQTTEEKPQEEATLENNSENDNGQGTTSQSETGTLAYHEASLEKNWETDAGEVACTVKLAYPIFEGTSTAEEMMNAFYEEWASDKLEAYENDPESIVKSALQLKNDPEYADFPASEEDFMLESVTIRPEVISVYQSFYSYSGGAHGMPGRENHMFDPETGKEITLENLTGMSSQELNDKMRSMFLELVENDEENKFFPEAADTLAQKDNFTSNFYLNEEGVVFYMQPYEIAPYAAGFTEIVVPYAQLGIA